MVALLSSSNRANVGHICICKEATSIAFCGDKKLDLVLGDEDRTCTEASPLKPILMHGGTKISESTGGLQRKSSSTDRLVTLSGGALRMRPALLAIDLMPCAVKARALLNFDWHLKRAGIAARDIARAYFHAIESFEIMRGHASNIRLDDPKRSRQELAEQIEPLVSPSSLSRRRSAKTLHSRLTPKSSLRSRSSLSSGMHFRRAFSPVAMKVAGV